MILSDMSDEQQISLIGASWCALFLWQQENYKYSVVIIELDVVVSAMTFLSIHITDLSVGFT